MGVWCGTGFEPPAMSSLFFSLCKRRNENWAAQLSCHRVMYSWISPPSLLQYLQHDIVTRMINEEKCSL
jgi:hypothetical protein